MKGTALKDQPDFLAVLVTLAAIFWSPALASIIAPYSVIIIAATTGASWALGRRDPEESRPRAALFFIRVNFMAIMFTVTICNLLETYVFHREMKWSLAFVALFIGWIGDDWPRVFAWALRRGYRLLPAWAKDKGKSNELDA